jgi:hypothetical protein
LPSSSARGTEARRAVERDNRRRQDDYDAKVKAAQRRVRDLNARFADWYYIVPTKEYAKIAKVKNACLKAGFQIKKSELLRIGIALISDMEPEKLKSAQAKLEPIKTGRPKKQG